jgi:hypothetical protein
MFNFNFDEKVLPTSPVPAVTYIPGRTTKQEFFCSL